MSGTSRACGELLEVSAPLFARAVTLAHIPTLRAFGALCAQSATPFVLQPLASHACLYIFRDGTPKGVALNSPEIYEKVEPLGIFACGRALARDSGKGGNQH